MLYRGESLDTHKSQHEQIRAKGASLKVAAKFDGSVSYNGKFIYDASEENAVRAQHLESAKWDTYFISTTRNWLIAKIFATSNNSRRGVIYWIHETLFKKNGVISKEFADSLYPLEREVSIRASDGGPIPEGVIFKIRTSVQTEFLYAQALQSDRRASWTPSGQTARSPNQSVRRHSGCCRWRCSRPAHPAA